MIKKYRISEKAVSDLEKIWLYTLKKWSREQADRYHNLIIEDNIIEAIRILHQNMDIENRLKKMIEQKIYTRNIAMTGT